MFTRALGAACLCAATIAECEPMRLSGSEIRDLVAGATVEIDAPLGNKLPVRYTPQGELSGEARDLAPYLGAPSDSGRWWVAADELCHKWNTWFNSEPQCLRLRREGRTIYWRSQDGSTGTAVIVAAAQGNTSAVSLGTQADDKMRLSAAEPPPLSATPVVAPAPRSLPVVPEATAEQADAMGAAGARVQQPSRAAAAALGARPPAWAELKGADQPPFFMVANVDPDDVLNVRRGPSTEFDVIAELEPGSRGITITGACLSAWCPVQHQTTNGWVNRMYLASEEPLADRALSQHGVRGESLSGDRPRTRATSLTDSPEAPRTCLTPPARALLARIEEQFGPVQVISTCRPGATIAGTGRPSRHASGNAVDFNAGDRKGEIVQWLIANHHDGGTMTYADMDHIHIDIGRHFVSLASGTHWPKGVRRMSGGAW